MPADNTAPTISGIDENGYIINEDTAITINFTVGDAETPAGNLTVLGVSNDLLVFPNENIVFGGSGASRTVTITPASNKFGARIIIITVTDEDGASANVKFMLWAQAVNDSPTLNAIPNAIIITIKNTL